MIKLTKATQNDLKTVQTLETEANSPTYSALLDDQSVQNYLSNSEIYLIKKGNKVVGTVSYEKTGKDEYEFNGLTITKSAQGRGIAKQAVAKVLQLIPSQNIWLYTHPDNLAAQKVYQANGFATKSHHENVFGDGVPRIKMVLEAK